MDKFLKEGIRTKKDNYIKGKNRRKKFDFEYINEFYENNQPWIVKKFLFNGKWWIGNCLWMRQLECDYVLDVHQEGYVDLYAKDHLERKNNIKFQSTVDKYKIQKKPNKFSFQKK